MSSKKKYWVLFFFFPEFKEYYRLWSCWVFEVLGRQ
jgi:hypothetical protein